MSFQTVVDNNIRSAAPAGPTGYLGYLTLPGDLATPLVAFSVRKVVSAYGGNCLRVRRSNDNAEQDIGFDSSGILDESALTTFVGANSAYVVKWYDQSGNGYNVSNATATKQPRIVNAGTIEKDSNGNVVLASRFTEHATDDFLLTSVDIDIHDAGQGFSALVAGVIFTTGGVSTFASHWMMSTDGLAVANFRGMASSTTNSTAGFHDGTAWRTHSAMTGNRPFVHVVSYDAGTPANTLLGYRNADDRVGWWGNVISSVNDNNYTPAEPLSICGLGNATGSSRRDYGTSEVVIWNNVDIHDSQGILSVIDNCQYHYGSQVWP